jgi:Ni/Fe-hydrogenase subunit HybB-like protein
MSHDAAVPSDLEVLRDIGARLPVTPDPVKRRVFLALMAIGIVSFVYLLATNPLRGWGSWAINTLYFLGIAQGGVVLAAAIRLANGRWGGPIMRIGESFASYLPFGIATMVVLLAAGIWTYLPWTTKYVDPRLTPFLNVPFLIIRTLGGLALFWWLASKLVRASLRRDLYLLAPFVPPALKPVYDRQVGTWRGDDVEAKAYSHEVSHLAPQIALTFVAFFSVMSWDFIMALTPNWVSPLFGWFVYAGAFISGVSVVALLATRLRAKRGLEGYITPHMFWDIGKVLFAWCIFWAYLMWSQYLPIWYADMPEETWWVFLRFEDPWRPLAFTAFTMIFVIPFLGMLNKTSKENPALLATFTCIVLVGLWIERHVLVMPSLNPDQVWVGLPELGLTAGFAGLFGFAVQGFLAKFPCVKVVDELEHAVLPEH